MNLEAQLNGLDLFGDPVRRRSSGPVAERFLTPPFSTLDARSGDWTARKQSWLSVGIKGEEGRNCYVGGKSSSSSCYTGRNASGKIATVGELHTEGGGNLSSIFDPVLCECMYRWFTPEGGQVLDPFAGGSVRGIVAGMLGRRYWGCDLRPEQVAANIQQAVEIEPEVKPVWVCGDSRETLGEAPRADFLFSCPPYGDLERYSDDPADLSTLTWPEFLSAYADIIVRSVARLKPHRFACFVVGDFRDKRGYYRDFVSSTIAAFRATGAELYNDAVLLTPVGSACLRVSRQFAGGRKFVKTHQNVLVFCKGDWKQAVAALD